MITRKPGINLLKVLFCLLIVGKIALATERVVLVEDISALF